jgi:HK97 family phage portal protein
MIRKRSVKKQMLNRALGNSRGQMELEELLDHPILNLLYMPNQYMTKTEFQYITISHLLLAGEAFWFVVRNRMGMPVEMYPLYPDRMKLVFSEGTIIGSYEYKSPGGSVVSIEPKDIIHHKRPNPTNIWRGFGTVRAAARAVDTDANAADYNKNFFVNAAKPSLALIYPNQLEDEDFERLKEEIVEDYTGTANAHKTMVYDNDVKIQTIGAAQKDMEFLEGRKFNRDQILAMWRISASMLGINEDANRASVDADDYKFAKRNIKPKMAALCDRITADLASQFDTKIIIDFTDPVPEDKEFEMKRDTESVNTIETVNEIRARRGMDPIKGGDSLYVPMNMVPIGEEPTPVAEPEEEEPAEETQAQGDDEDPSEETKAMRRGLYASDGRRYILVMRDGKLRREYIDPNKKYTDDPVLREETGSRLVENQIRISKGYESHIRKALTEYFEAQKSEVLKNVEKALNQKSFEYRKAKWFDLDKWVDKMVAKIKPSLKGTINDIGQEAGILVGHNFNADSDNISTFLGTRSKKVSKEVNAETDRRLKAAIAEGIANGEGTFEIGERVKTIYDQAEGYRSERIARTETIRASGFAHEEAWKQSGVVEGKEWFTAKDERVCEFCGPMDGNTRFLDQEFFAKDVTLVGDKGGTLNFGFDSIDTPPLHVNCRCAMLPILKDN